MVNGDGETENWIDVAQSDGGRIVAVRNKPGRMSSFSWFKIWEPERDLHRRGPAQRPERLEHVRLSARLRHHRGRVAPRLRLLELERLLPDQFAHGTYVRPATNSVLNPIDTSGQTHPSLFGSRIISLEDSSSPTIINVQDAGAGNPYTNAFTPWLDTSGVGLDLEGVDVAANGRLAALGFEAWNGGTQTVGKIAVLAIQGVDQAPAFPAAVDCFCPRPASRGTHRSRRTPARSHGRTTAA